MQLLRSEFSSKSWISWTLSMLRFKNHGGRGGGEINNKTLFFYEKRKYYRCNMSNISTRNRLAALVSIEQDECLYIFGGNLQRVQSSSNEISSFPPSLRPFHITLQPTHHCLSHSRQRLKQVRLCSNHRIGYRNRHGL